MSPLSKGIFGTIAVSLTLGTLGAVQLAAGRDIIGTQVSAASSEAVNTSAAINQAAKADRADGAVGTTAVMRTISLRLDALTATSVLIRLPVAQGNGNKEARNRVPAPSVVKPQARKTTVACEPPVSVLTEVAKRLEPGRCVT